MNQPVHDHERTAAQPAPSRPGLAMNSRRKLMIIGIVFIAIGGLVVLKHEGKKATQQLSAEIDKNAVSDEEIKRAMLKEYGGISKNAEQVALVERVGGVILEKISARKNIPPIHFHVVAEANSINLFALPGGDIYVTTALVNRMQTEGQLAAALCHGIAHILGNDRTTRFDSTKQFTAVPLWVHSAAQEKAADRLGIALMAEAGYDPSAFSAMLIVLAGAYHAGADVAFFTTHPNDADRLANITAIIAELYPSGIPAILSK